MPQRNAAFVLRLDALRLKHKIKRNFIKLVEQKRKFLYLFCFSRGLTGQTRPEPRRGDELPRCRSTSRNPDH